MKIILTYLILFIVSFDSISQQFDIQTIYTTPDGIQSSQLFVNTGSAFMLKDDPFKIQKDENGTLFPKLTVNGDFDGDGFDEAALFYDYTYIPNGISKFIASKVVLFKQINNRLIPVGTWFSALKTDFSFDNISFASAADFNGDGKADIALIYNNSASDLQKIYVLQSTGTKLEMPKEALSIDRNVFNFNALKQVVAADFTGDTKADLAVFYNYFGTTPDVQQKVFVFESQSTIFKPAVALYSSTKATTNFSNYLSALAGDYNGDGKADIACITNDVVSGNQSIDVFEYTSTNTLTLKNYLQPDRNDFNFSNVKMAVSGLITADNKTDLVLCYNHTGFGTQIFFTFESNGTTFLPYKNYYFVPKTSFSLDNVNALLCGKYNSNPKVTPTVWADNKKGAITFGFDDGLTNALRYGATELTKNKLKGTFYIISNVPYNNEVDYCNWDTLRYYRNLGHEMASHSANHRTIGNYTGIDSLATLNTLLLKSRTDLNQELNQKTISLSYPFGNFNKESTSEVGKYFLNARSSQEGYNLPTPFDFLALKSLYIASTTPNATIKSWFQTSETYNYHISLMYHNIQKNAFDKIADEYSFALSDLQQNIADAKQANVWIETQENVYKYVCERNACALQSYAAFADSVHAVVDDKLDNGLFNQKITLKIQVPAAWSLDSVYTNKSVARSAVFTENGLKYCYVNTVPDNSLIRIAKSKIQTALAQNFQIETNNLIVSRIDNHKVFVNYFSNSTGGNLLQIYDISGCKITEINLQQFDLKNIEIPLSFYIGILKDRNGKIIARTKFR